MCGACCAVRCVVFCTWCVVCGVYVCVQCDVHTCICASCVCVCVCVCDVTIGWFFIPVCSLWWYLVFSFSVALGPGEATLFKMGATNSNAIKSDAQLWRVFTSMFLHAGLLDLFFNLLCLLRLGLFLERRWGWIRLSAIFLFCGVGGSLMSCLLQPRTTTVGASGALGGVIAAYLCEVICCACICLFVCMCVSMKMRLRVCTCVYMCLCTRVSL
jgi:Rhomboid family